MKSMQTQSELKYVGFWARVGVTIIDSILIVIITFPLLISIYGWEYFASESHILGPMDFLISWVFPSIAIILFWKYKSATPGKMLISAKIVDARTGMSPSNGQLIIRYLGYFVSMLPFCLGYIWVAFDKRKQGWHDKLAGTVVIRSKHREPESVHFESNENRRRSGIEI